MTPSRGKMLTARILVVVFAVLATIGLLAGFIRYQALDPDTFRDTAEELIGNENVQDQIATSLVDSLYANVDVAAALEDGCLPTSAALRRARRRIQELSYRTARRLLARPRVQTLFVDSLALTHRQLLEILDDDLTTVSTEGGFLVLNLRPLVVQLGDQIAIIGRVAERLPSDAGESRSWKPISSRPRRTSPASSRWSGRSPGCWRSRPALSRSGWRPDGGARSSARCPSRCSWSGCSCSSFAASAARTSWTSSAKSEICSAGGRGRLGDPHEPARGRCLGP